MGATWFLRATEDPVAVAELLEAGEVGLALDPAIGEDALLDERDTLVSRMQDLHPDWPPGHAGMLASEVHRFIHELELEDRLVLRDGANRRYLLGTVTSPVTHEAQAGGGLCWRRQVAWTHRVPRDRLPVRARHGLGGLGRLQRLDDELGAEVARAGVRIDAPAAGELVISPAGRQALPSPARADDIGIGALRVEVEARAGEFVEDMLVALEPMDLQAMLAGVLRAMGYRNRVSHEMRSASAGSATFEGQASAPTMMVELRHEPGVPVDAETVKTFIEGKNLRVRCLFLSTGGFTAAARQIAATTGFDLQLLGLPELRALVLEHYEYMDMESRALMPLKRLYWPTPS